MHVCLPCVLALFLCVKPLRVVYYAHAIEVYSAFCLKCFASKIKSRQKESVAEIKIIWKKESKIDSKHRKSGLNLRRKEMKKKVNIINSLKSKWP